jgi:20S proteasome subunit alpha 7
MSSIGTGYDLSAAQFSPDGQVFQVIYAQKAVENSGTVVGIRGKDGVVLGVERLITSKLYEDNANKRIFNIDRHIGMAIAGLLADARQIVDIARQECASYRKTFGTPIPCKVLAERVAMYFHAYTLYSFVRPFGCSVVLASYDADGPHMYTVEPSGICSGCFGATIGKAKQAAKTEIEKIKMKDMTINGLVKDVAKIIYTVHDEVKDKAFVLELSWVGAETGRNDTKKIPGGIHGEVPHDIHAEAERFAKAALEEPNDSDNDL